MLEEALGYPLQDENRLKTIGTGGLLYLVSGVAYYLVVYEFRDNVIAYPLLLAVFLIGLCLVGYSYRVFRMTAREEETVPTFTDWVTMLIQGLKLSGVTIAYFLPTILLFAISFITEGGLPFVSLLVFWAGTILGLIAWFFLPIAWTNLALTNRLGAGFEFKTIANATLTGRYILAVLLLIVLGTILNIIATILMVLLIGVFIQFYVQVALSSLIGSACGPTLRERQSEIKATS